MRAVESRFPGVRREVAETLQVNLGYRCNQQCRHCHVDAGPHRTEVMGDPVVSAILDLIGTGRFHVLDLTGGAPELHPRFAEIVARAAAAGMTVLDRCNLTILLEPGFEDLPAFLARHRVTVVASLPCYLEQNVDEQRGRGVHARSIRALRLLNGLGYGHPGSGLELDLVYNPAGPVLPPAQAALEADYRERLRGEHGIEFSRLLTLANMPIARFRRRLKRRGELEAYLDRLQAAHDPANLAALMCRRQVSVDWRGHLYDCDFNQMLGLPAGAGGGAPLGLADIGCLVPGTQVAVADHCYACTAGQGSSCGGALTAC